MEGIKKFIDCYVPIENCNFKCHYCYIPTLDNFQNKTRRIKREPIFFRKALSKERLDGICMFNFCAGGETLLSNELLPIIKELLKEGHYAMIVTNGSITPKFKEISTWHEELLKHLFIKFSFHYLELKRLNLMDTFWNNVLLMKKNNVSFTIEITPNDELVEHIEDIKKICIDYVGAIPHVTVARVENGNYPIMTNIPKNEYINIWSQFDSKLFDFKIKVFNEKRKEFCYAGKWSYRLDLESGDLRQCYRGKVIQNIYKDINQKIVERPIGSYCNEPHCFNSHAFLAFGDIPELETPTFADERNRLEGTPNEWLQNDMKKFMSTKLYDSNIEYSDYEKKKIDRRLKFKNSYNVLKKSMKKKIKKIIKRQSERG